MKLVYSKVYTHIATDLSAHIHAHMCVHLARDHYRAFRCVCCSSLFNRFLCGTSISAQFAMTRTRIFWEYGTRSGDTAIITSVITARLGPQSYFRRARANASRRKCERVDVQIKRELLTRMTHTPNERTARSSWVQANASRCINVRSH